MYIRLRRRYDYRMLLMQTRAPRRILDRVSFIITQINRTRARVTVLLSRGNISPLSLNLS